MTRGYDGMLNIKFYDKGMNNGVIMRKYSIYITTSELITYQQKSNNFNGAQNIKTNQ